MWQQNASYHAVCGIPLVLCFCVPPYKEPPFACLYFGSFRLLVQAFCFVFVLKHQNILD